MILTLLAFVILVFGIVAGKLKDNFDTWAGAVTLIGGLAVIGVVLCLALMPVSFHAEAESFESVRESLQIARESESISQFELAAIQQKVIESNRWLASLKYYAKHPAFNWFVPRDILDLTPIK